MGLNYKLNTEQQLKLVIKVHKTQIAELADTIEQKMIELSYLPGYGGSKVVELTKMRWEIRKLRASMLKQLSNYKEML